MLILFFFIKLVLFLFRSQPCRPGPQCLWDNWSAGRLSTMAWLKQDSSASILRPLSAAEWTPPSLIQPYAPPVSVLMEQDLLLSKQERIWFDFSFSFLKIRQRGSWNEPRTSQMTLSTVTLSNSNTLLSSLPLNLSCVQLDVPSAFLQVLHCASSLLSVREKHKIFLGKLSLASLWTALKTTQFSLSSCWYVFRKHLGVLEGCFWWCF